MIRYTRAVANAARNSADAAKASTDLSIALQAPRIALAYLNQFESTGTSTVQYVRGPLPKISYFQLSMKNDGGGPAIPDRCLYDWCVAAALLEEPSYRKELRFEAGTTFEGRSPASADIRETLNLSDVESEDIQSGRRVLWIWVKFTYLDILDARYESAFVAKFEPTSPPDIFPMRIGTSWKEEKSNKKYSYRRKLPHSA